MKKSIVQVGVSSIVLTFTGTTVNSVTYFTMQDMFLATTLSGRRMDRKNGIWTLIESNFSNEPCRK